jgi:6-phosphogluconolactonase (cycloisomerase 2 family)
MLLGVAGAGALVLVATPPALAVDLLALTDRGCVKDVGAAAACTTEALGLQGANRLTVSPDGTSLYVTAPANSTLIHLARNPAGGALTPVGCVTETAFGVPCAQETDNLSTPGNVVVSPDGANVYVAANGADSVIIFDRNTTTGALTPAGCIEDPPIGNCAQTAQGLDGTYDLAISPDGETLYARAGPPEHAITVLDRDTTTGALSFVECVEAPPIDRGCASSATGLTGFGDLAVTGDGENLYAVSGTDDALVVFDRNTTTGAITSPGCIGDAGTILCAATAEGLNEAGGLAVSPDDTTVYAVGRTDAAITRFTRDPGTGALTDAGCLKNVLSGAACLPVAAGLLGSPERVEVAPDGATVYVGGTDQFTVLARDTGTGSLTEDGCVADDGLAIGCATTAEGLDGANMDVTVSPNGAGVYATGDVDRSVVRLDRELAPTCEATSATTTAPTAVTVALSCSDPNADPLTYAIVTPPAGGNLSSFNPTTGEVTYTPSPGSSGDDTFTYRATSDGKDAAPALATVAVAPAPVDPAPPPPPPVGEPTPGLTPAPMPGDPAGPPPPVTGRSFNAEPTRGTVLVRRPSDKVFVAITDVENVPSGSIIDATRGAVRLTARQPDGTIERMTFFDGAFIVTQPRSARGVVDVELVGGDLSGCPTSSPGYKDWAVEQRRLFGRRAVPRRAGPAGRVASAKKKSTPKKRRGGKTRKLWADGKGRFRTSGREGSATVRGTRWLTEDTCTTTRFRVRDGTVVVRDRATGSTFVLRRGRTVSTPFTVATLRRIASGGRSTGTITTKARRKLRVARRR